MARLESIAVGGYYKTPISQLPKIARLLSAPKAENESYEKPCPSILDPCAGDGEAIRFLAEALSEKTECYTCELEKGRRDALVKGFRHWKDAQRALGGDAFRVYYERNTSEKGVGLLYLNPPYDIDKVHGRLEERFLARFYDVLAPGGVLAFVVPYYALAASARTLAGAFERLSCYRFTADEYAAYKQVVLFAVRRQTPALATDEEIVSVVNGWAADAESIPVLPDAPTFEAIYTVPQIPHYGKALAEWAIRETDTIALLGKFRPWTQSAKPGACSYVEPIRPTADLGEIMHRVYETAMPPRPAHIAAGLANGLFNGRRVDPDEASSGLPPLLIKGVFDKEWRTVEQKQNKDGEVTSVVEVQQPKLVITVLDLRSHRYHTLASGEATAGADPREIASMSVGDVLKHYGQSLTSVMERQCRVLYDPRRDAGSVEVAPAARKPFSAQAHAVRANVTLLRQRRGRSPVLLGEIGSGKSLVSLLTAKTFGARRVLVLCPPHLLDSWKNEVAATVPESAYRLLQTVSSVDALRDESGPFVAVLSREAAKLGHAVEGVKTISCPACGQTLPGGDYAKRRVCCEAQRVYPKDVISNLCIRLALAIRPYAAGDATLRAILPRRLYGDGLCTRRLAAGLPESAREPGEFPGIPDDLMAEIRMALAWLYSAGEKTGESLSAFRAAYVAAPDADFLGRFVGAFYDAHDYSSSVGNLLLLAVDSPEAQASALAVAAGLPVRQTYYGTNIKERLEEVFSEVAENGQAHVGNETLRRSDEGCFLSGVRYGSAEAAKKLLQALSACGKWGKTRACGERLYGAVPEPRRFPLAKRIVQKHRKTFDFLIVDEGHEYATDGSAQERAAHRLTSLRLPTVFMTGSVMNGYAESLFTNMWAVSPEFRAEFSRDESGVFSDRYGYRKRVLQDRDAQGEVIAFGSQTDRVDYKRTERDAGAAPGVLPDFLFRYLLPSAVTLHKADLRIDLPTCTQTPLGVEVDGVLESEYKRLAQALKSRIVADRFEEGLSGKLFGALAELPSYLDRATEDVGNGPDGFYTIAYPESCGGDLVATAKSLPASTILPKEARMLKTIREELDEGRNVMVFAWHLSLLPRLSRLIEAHTGEKAPILYADKVPTAKRQAWIDKEIVKKGRRVMVANPVSIQTGLNNLVHFSTEWWHENPACNPIVYRQAIGRIDRIGQRLPTRVYSAHYSGTLQQNLYDLLISKVAISTATDGLDPESALRAAGIVEDEYLTGLSIGKQLWAMMSETQ
jgi:SAM-dependent methyltransferase